MPLHHIESGFISNLYNRTGLHTIMSGIRALAGAAAPDTTLLAGETDGLAIDWTATSDFALSTWAMQAVQERNSSTDTLQSPHVFFTQSGTSPKYVQNSSTTIGWSPHNLCLQSEDIATTWTNLRTTESTNATTAPDGTSTADKLIEDVGVATNYRLVQSISVTTGLVYTFSIYAKAAERSWVRIGADTTRFADNTFAYFDLTNGVVGSLGAGGISHSITSVGSGWYRCALTALCDSTGANDFEVFIAEADNDITFNGDGTSGLYLWGAQLNRGHSATAYMSTTTASRIGLPISYAQGLLVEPVGTNIILQSENIGTTWTNGNSTESVNATTAPDGGSTADKLIEASDTAQEHYIRQGTLSVTSGTAYTFSCYLKAAERTWARLSLLQSEFSANTHCDFNLGTGAEGTNGAGITNASIESIGSGWYRCSITATAAATDAANAQVSIGEGDTDVTYNGDGTSGIYVWGAQFETGTVATSYIPTVGSTATRAADNVNVATSAFGFSATEGTVYFDGTACSNLTAATRAGWNFDDGSTDEAILFYIDTSSNPTFSVYDNDVGNEQIGPLDLGTAVGSERAQSTCAWKANDCAGSYNGGTVLSDTSASLPTVTTLYLGSNPTPSIHWNSFIRRFAYVPRRVPT
jgi:hypothetical protein